MSHEVSITVERDGKHYVESSVKPGEVLEGPFNTEKEALKRSIQRSKEYNKHKYLKKNKQKDLSKGGLV
jgi:hypothetical protein|tara:strand:+ start:235 stop:441 length:207 start_codon:yes stop_codon:yes gene_type:complete